MLKKLLITTALSGLMLSSALAQSPSSPSSSPSPSASPSDSMKSDTSKTATTGASSASAITTQKPDQMLVSNLKGVDVLGSDDKKIGDISDILVSKDGKVEAYLVSVGGFLGVGAKEVALAPSSIQLTQENNSWKAKISMTKDQLAQAPDFERYKDKTATTGSAGSGMGSQRSTPAGAPGNAPASRP